MEGDAVRHMPSGIRAPAIRADMDWTGAERHSRRTWSPTPCRWPLLVAMLLLPLFAACQTLPAGRIVTPPPQSSDPPLNPDPKDVIRLHGRAPETLEFWLQIAFRSTNSEDDCVIDKSFWEGGGQKGWGYDLHPIREGGRWHADLVADRHLPGHCQWEFTAGATMHIALADQPEIGALAGAFGDMRMLESPPREYWECDERHRHFDCDSQERLRRLKVKMDPSVPVQLACKRNPPRTRRIGDLPFECNSLRMQDYKEMHWLRPGQREVRIDIYDLDHEDPPIPALIPPDKEVEDE